MLDRLKALAMENVHDDNLSNTICVTSVNYKCVLYDNSKDNMVKK